MIEKIVELVPEQEQDRARFIAELEKAITFLRSESSNITAVAWVMTMNSPHETGCHYGVAGLDTLGLVGALDWARHDMLRARMELQADEES